MTNCTAPSPTGPPQVIARVCHVDGWRVLPAHRDLVCLKCEIRIGRDLDELGALAGRLGNVAHDPNFGASIPLRINAYDLALPGRLFGADGPQMDQIGMTPLATELAGWVGVWRDWGAPHGPVRSYASAWSVASWFSARLPWACREHGRIAEFATVLRQLVGTARREAGEDTPRERLSLPCVACRGFTLTRVWADTAESLSGPFVECGECEWWWDETEYATVKARQLVSAIPPDTLLTAADIAIARPGVLAANVRDWKRRRKLRPVPGPWGGKAVYVLSEVDELITGIVAARVARHLAQQEHYEQEMIAA